MGASPDAHDQSLSARRARMWQSMRIMRGFTASDLAATAFVNTSAAYRYILQLEEMDYVERVPEPNGARVVKYRAAWKLIRDTGPYAPIPGADPNLDRAITHITIPRTEYERALKCVRACAGMEDPERAVSDLKRRAGDA